MATERVEARINTLLTAIDKKGKQLLAAPDSGLAARLKELLEAYKVELENLNRYGESTTPSGNPVGAGVNVPAGGSG